MKIVSDSSIMLTVAEGARKGIDVLPLAVTIGAETWLEYEDISTAEFLDRVRAGGVPQSSSPPPALTLEAYNTEEEVLHIAMADGLSGAYHMAASLVPQAVHPEKVHVINATTLCVPQRALVYRAKELADSNFGAAAAIEKLKPMIESTYSYLIPNDFAFLRRGGRLTPVAAAFAGLLKAVPVMVQTADRKRLERLSISRSLKKAVSSVIADCKKRGIAASYFISISHADNLEGARLALQQIKQSFPDCRHGVFNLGPAFITQGGPGCIAIQLVDLATCPDLVLEA
ncbi:MAG: DegV family protein [Eggerthellaceae bacterium]